MRWTEESRAKQAARIRAWKPWQKATGPNTTEGRSRAARNADKGQWRRHVRELSQMLRQIKSNMNQNAGPTCQTTRTSNGDDGRAGGQSPHGSLRSPPF